MTFTQPAPTLTPMTELDQAGSERFVDAVSPLFEGAPRFVARLATGRPYGTYGVMLQRAIVIGRTMPEDEQLELLAAHPRIGADPASVSALSFREQGYEHHDRPGDGLQQRLERLNDAYERRFGFRYVVFVAGRPRSAIADEMEERLNASRDDERYRALNDTVSIAADRLRSLGFPTETP